MCNLYYRIQVANILGPLDLANLDIWVNLGGHNWSKLMYQGECLHNTNHSTGLFVYQYCKYWVYNNSFTTVNNLI